jgi:hypothetical protein
MTDTTPASPSGPPQPRDRGLLVVTGLTLFCVSTLFPILASLASGESLPAWIGWLDVALAVAVIGLGMAIDAAARGKIDGTVRQDAYRLYRLLLNVPIILLALFFVWGDHIRWEILLPGLAWRAWLLGYVLPAGIAGWRH